MNFDPEVMKNIQELKQDTGEIKGTLGLFIATQEKKNDKIEKFIEEQREINQSQKHINESQKEINLQLTNLVSSVNTSYNRREQEWQERRAKLDDIIKSKEYQAKRISDIMWDVLGKAAWIFIAFAAVAIYSYVKYNQ